MVMWLCDLKTNSFLPLFYGKLDKYTVVFIHIISGGVIFYMVSIFCLTKILWKRDLGVIILYRIVTCKNATE